jgi:methylamine dehydrogenase accessory protein MauD
MTSIWIASLVALWVVVLVMAFLLAGALRQLGLIYLRLGEDPGALITDTGLERGAEAPDFSARDLEGNRRRLSELPAQPRLLVFLTTSCASCQQIIPAINEVATTRQDEFDFLVLCQGDEYACAEFARANRLAVPMWVDREGEVNSLYQVNVTPFAYLLDWERNVVIRGVANDWRHLESLLEQEGTLQAGRPLLPTDEEAIEEGEIHA